MVQIQGIHPSPRYARLSSLPVLPSGHYASGRLTSPYPGGLPTSLQIPHSAHALPGHPTLFSHPSFLKKNAESREKKKIRARRKSA